eukprot:20260-Heterococcus_DN1.PRE.2
MTELDHGTPRVRQCVSRHHPARWYCRHKLRITHGVVVRFLCDIQPSTKQRATAQHATLHRIVLAVTHCAHSHSAGTQQTLQPLHM